MAKRLTIQEQNSHDLVEWLIKDFDKRLKDDGLGKEDLLAKVGEEIGVSPRHLRNWLARGNYPKGLYASAVSNYKTIRMEAA